MARRKKGGPLRSGYTTGACAAAAARAAMMALLKQEAVNHVQVALPRTKASFKVNQCVFDRSQASCSVIKDAGDDPDVTHRAEIWATVSWKDEPGISIGGGEGVGVATKPGLEIAVGEAAINPVPRRMIERSVREVMPEKNAPQNNRGVEVTISVAEGEKLAQKTLNPRLGIVKGISILGTTGVVIPYSVSAYKACISQGLDVAVACGCRQIVLTTGRRSEKFAQRELALAEECFLQAGDFIGYSLGECAKKNLTKVTIWGMTGKLSKLAAGHMYTNVSHSRVDINFLAGVAADCGVPEEIVKALKAAVTANHLRKMLPPEYSQKFCNKLCLLAAERCRHKAGGKLEVECIMSSYDGVILGRANAKG
jgi:cobalt-precorrin-5B (C1)-methyltransferase